MSSHTSSSKDREYMQLALKLAEMGGVRVRPNPLVGCVVVKNGRVVGQGYHRVFGGPHAEVMALRKAGRLAKGSDLYVSLDPCRHTGKTPPCTDAILDAGVRRVFSGTDDPHDRRHEGERILKKAGVQFFRGLLQDECRVLNQVYFKNVSLSLPYVTVKMATTLDGKIATASGESRGISSDASLREVHRLRASSDAILTGSGTVIRDNPHLGVRFISGKDPLRVVLDSTLKIPLSSAVFRDNRVIVFCGERAARRRISEFKERGIELIFLSEPHSLKSVLTCLYEREIYSLFVEAGSTLVTSLLRDQLVDRYIQFIAPKLLGGIHSPTPFGGNDPSGLADAMNLAHVSTRRFDNDTMVDGYLRLY